MKKKSASQSAFFNLRTLLGFSICLAGILLALFAFGPNPAGSALAQNSQQPNAGRPDVRRMVGPVRLDQDLRKLPYIAPKEEFEERRLMRYPHNGTDQTNAVRIRDCRHEIRPVAAQKYVAADAHDAGTAADF